MCFFVLYCKNSKIDPTIYINNWNGSSFSRYKCFYQIFLIKFSLGAIKASQLVCFIGTNLRHDLVFSVFATTFIYIIFSIYWFNCSRRIMTNELLILYKVKYYYWFTQIKFLILAFCCSVWFWSCVWFHGAFGRSFTSAYNTTKIGGKPMAIS